MIACLAMSSAAIACTPTFEPFCPPAECDAGDGGIADRPDDGGGEPDLGVDEPPDARVRNVGWIAKGDQGPPGRNRHLLVYSPKARGTIMTGGGDGDLWIWRGSAWMKLDDPPFGALYDAAAAEDRHGDVVVFGGRSGNGPKLDDTWTWDGRTWSERSPAHKPTPRIFIAMAYDREREVSVLFGGIGAGEVPLGDTWEWDGDDWSEKHPSRSPEPRGYYGMTYDPDRERVVLFGGGENQAEGGVRYGDLFGFDGDRWESINTREAGPSKRGDLAMGYDLSRRAIVIFGGSDYFPYFNDTWELRNGAWQEISAGATPTGVTNARMDYDRAGERMVMFGGWNNVASEGTTYLLETVE